MAKNNSKRREAIAYHEAGHAVMSIVVRQAFRYVTIVSSEDSLGHVQHTDWGENFQPDIEMNSRIQRQIENSVLTLLAGRVAEKRLTGRWNHVGASYDLHQAVKLAGYVWGDDTVLPSYMSFMHARAQSLVANERNWVAIQAVATALLVQPKIGSRKVRRIVAGARQQLWEASMKEMDGDRLPQLLADATVQRSAGGIANSGGQLAEGP